jgi:hypothetical protein
LEILPRIIMPSQRLRFPSLTSGVNTKAPHERLPGTVAVADNTMMRVERGLEKRSGTEFLSELLATAKTADKYVHWIDRDDDEKFVVLVDPNASGTNRIEVFTLVEYTDTSDPPVTYQPCDKLPLVDDSSLADYLSFGDDEPYLRFSSLSVADSTIFLNRQYASSLAGAAITYTNSQGNIRSKANNNNVNAWSDLPQPPAGTRSGEATTDEYIYYAQDDDLGWPSGWYAAVSTTYAPWYKRIRTESSFSLIDESTMPIQLKFDGVTFSLVTPDWSPRFSGDNFTNPGPNILARPYGQPIKIRDIAFFQSRMFLGGDEFVDSSQASDIFNLWQESQSILVDSDPVRVQTQSDAITLIDWLLPTDSGLLILTNGSRQFVLTSNGAMTPTASVLTPVGSLNTSPNIRPVKLGNSVYFGTERNNALVLYQMSSQQGGVTTTEVTESVQGYIPGPIRQMTVSEQNEMIFFLTDAEPGSIYVAQKSGERHAFMRWTFNGDQILSVKAYNSYLYMVIKRDNRLWLERINIDVPVYDDDGLDYLSQNMGFSVRMDQRVSVQGVYADGVTSWTLPYADAGVDTVVLGQGFDTEYNGGAALQQWRGRIIKDTLTIENVGDTTVISVPGKYDTNLNQQPAQVWIGRSYEMVVQMNEPFLPGNTEGGQVAPDYAIIHMRTGMIRLTDSAALTVKITPYDRPTVSRDFFTVQVGMYILGEPLVLADDEFHFNILGAAHNTKVEFTNNTPYPSRINSLDLAVTLNSYRRDPSRGTYRG